MPDNLTEVNFQASINAIKSFLPDKLQNPLVGIVCGSGLSGLADEFKDKVIVPYEDIPGFAKSTGEPRPLLFCDTSRSHMSVSTWP